MRCRSANIKGLPGGGEEDDLGSLLRKLSSLAKHWKTRAGTADAGEVYRLKKLLLSLIGGGAALYSGGLKVCKTGRKERTRRRGKLKHTSSVVC